MTISSRNRILIGILAVSSILAAGILAGGIITFLQTEFPIALPPSVLRWIPILDSFFLTPASFIPAILSLLVFGIYTPAALFFLYYQFEKTQAVEVIFFTGFLFACQLEGLRILIPLFGLEQTYPELLLTVCRVVFFARTFAILCFLFTSLFSASGLFQQAGKNIYFLIAVAILFSSLMPLNTERIASTFMVTYGYAHTYMIIRFVLFAVSILAFIITGKHRGLTEYTKAAYAGVVLLLGYGLLICTDNWVFLGAGTLLLTVGSRFFMRYIHKYYLWQ
ncbi:MAG: hypothetical protein LBU99_06175 [Spirochaetaceae bacterium]|jgi:hypothetical protein|nr:hypothetical protein [Spirochaetaceae bacterium]